MGTSMRNAIREAPLEKTARPLGGAEALAKVKKKDDDFSDTKFKNIFIEQLKKQWLWNPPPWTCPDALCSSSLHFSSGQTEGRKQLLLGGTALETSLTGATGSPRRSAGWS